jgi:tetratricopeptide (TPR) repeat protein
MGIALLLQRASLLSSAQLLLLYSAWPERAVAAEEERATGPECVAFRRTAGCSPAGARDARLDVGCDQPIPSDWAGFCECDGFTTGGVGCGHEEFSCRAACAARWAEMQGAAGGASPAEREPAEPRTVADADSDLERLYQRGKQFYVVGNIELAIRHYREALRQDPDHAPSKADFKKLKKLQRAMAEAEAKLPKVRSAGDAVR